MNKLLTWYWMTRVAIAARRREIKQWHATLRHGKPCWRSYKEIHAIIVSLDDDYTDDEDLR